MTGTVATKTKQNKTERMSMKTSEQMKKLALTTLTIAGLSAAALAQGIINWTAVGGNLEIETNSTVYSAFAWYGGSSLFGSVGPTLGNNSANDASLGYDGYQYELLASATAVAAPTSVAALGSWLDTGLSGTNSSNAGRMIQVNGSPGSVANNWIAGAASGIVLVGWSENLGASYSAVLSVLQNWGTDGPTIIGPAYFGVSAYGNVVSGTAGPGLPVFGSSAGLINNPDSNPMMLDELPIPFRNPARWPWPLSVAPRS
jgi:hypothetical protein